MREGVGAEVDVVEGAAGLDAGDVEGVPARGAEGRRRGRGRGAAVAVVGVARFQELLVDRERVVAREQEFEAHLAGGIVAVDDHIAPGDGDSAGGGFRQVGQG